MRSALSLAFANVLLTGAMLQSSHAGGLIGDLVREDIGRSLDASDSGLMNGGLAGGGSSVLDARLGGSLSDANVSVGGNESLVGAGVDKLGGAVGINTIVCDQGTVGIGVTIGSHGSGVSGPGSPVIVPGQQAMRASNISIKAVTVCPEVKVWLSTQLAGSGLGSTLQNLVLFRCIDHYRAEPQSLRHGTSARCPEVWIATDSLVH